MYWSATRALLSVTALLALGAGIVPQAQALGADSTPTTQTAPGGFAVTPEIADATCNGGKGASLDTNGAAEAVVASGVLSDGSTVTAFSEIYPGKTSAVLDSVTSQCAPNPAFGNSGVATVKIPSQLVPATKGSTRTLWINAVSARAGGGAIVAGTYRNRWVVGTLDPNGALDPAFGSGGWTALPWRGQVTAILQLPSGRIVVGGDNGGGGCCTVNHAATVSAQGRLDRSFGNGGRVRLPTGEDSGVDSLALEPNGDILAQVQYGNMGCWGDGLAMLTRSGKPVTDFAKRLGAFWRRLGFGAFVGDVYVDSEGFTLVGTGEKPCADGPKISTKSASGVLAHFRTSGTAARKTVRFPSKLYRQIAAFADGPGTLIAESSYGNGASETLKLLHPDGSTDTSFGKGGSVVVRSPWRGSNADALDSMSIIQATDTSLVVIATDGHKHLQVIRLNI